MTLFRNSMVTRWLKFNAVGGIGIMVQLGALVGLKSGFHLGYLPATVLAVEVAVIHNFLWHERYTWRDRVRPAWSKSLPRLLRFNLTTGAVSIGGNLALMKLLVGLGHVNYLLANGIAIALCSVANFLISEEWVFGKGLHPVDFSCNQLPEFTPQSSAPLFRSSSHPAAACKPPLHDPEGRPGRSPATACAAQSIPKAASTRVP
jgi:putative flippase GtrA